MSDVLSASYVLVVAEVRLGLFEERNLDTIGLGRWLGSPVYLLLPDNASAVDASMVDKVITVGADEGNFQNPLTMVSILTKVFETRGQPDFILFTHSSSGAECAAYAAGHFSLPVITDVSGFDRPTGTFSKSYYSDKVFAQFKSASSPSILTVRSGSFREQVTRKQGSADTESLGAFTAQEGRTFLDYVEEAGGAVDITKADFLLSVGRGIGSKDEIPRYEELAQAMKAVLSCSRPVVDKLWLPKERQVGTSGKTVKPKVYLAMAISGAFQHIAGMKDADCIIAINKDPEAPIFQYAHFGIVADVNKLRDKLMETAKAS
ncbi:MAG TPA: electron transfer flavoprotein subunit alpha/FixB family protein [Syntrophorhabdales bacterium]|nr:electron transfer flavoprotein subunit alpha/FixB family protein [Syntrophorhabdales bacterium]